MRDELLEIPGVGKSIANDLHRLGVHSINDLLDANPEALYERLMLQTGCHIDRCILYVFRCAVYFASEPQPDSEKLKWWNWSDKAMAS